MPPGSEDSDNTIVTRIRAGDMEALGILVRKHYTDLVRFAFSIIRSMDVAEDIVQTVLCNVCENRATWSPHNVKAYLLAAVRSRALNEIKHESVRARHESTILAEYDCRAADEGDSDASDQADALLRQLPETQQTAVRLRYQHDLSFSEIASVLGVTPGAAERMIQRAIAGLRGNIRG